MTAPSPSAESSNNQAVCAQLGRPDKWYLGGGDRLTWTPPHPEWLDRPGFWDEAHYYDLPFAPLFTATLLGENGQPLSLQCTGRHWQPDRLRQRYEAADAPLTMTEEKAVVPEDVLVSRLSVANSGSSARTLHLIVWTEQPVRPNGPHGGGVMAVEPGAEHLQFVRRLRLNDRPHHDLGCTLALSTSPTSRSVVPSESGPGHPHWPYTPFYETFRPDRLGPPPTRTSVDDAGVVYLGLHTRLRLTPGVSQTISAGLGGHPSPARASERTTAVLADNPIAQSTSAWTNYFDSLPGFECSDPYLQRYYWHRWYGLRLFTRREEEGNFRHPAVFEGPEYFRKHVTYSAQCHMLETRWQSDPAVAQGSLLNFLDHQHADGAFTGHLYPHDADEESFYHTNWGHVWDVYRTHPDEEFLQRAYDGLSDYVDYFDAERDPDDSGLYDIWNHYETGQEYMHRYQAVSDEADEIHWGRIFRLKGVDAAVQLYQTKKALARMANALDRPAEAEQWRDRAATTKAAVLDHMWDPETELFFDVDPETGERTGVKAAVCFYPYFTDIVDERHLPGLKQHLFDPDEFWTEHPVPASSADDPYFSDVPHWKGERKNCPWNGRVWPMTNSHVAEAICQAALRFDDDELRQRGAEFIRRFVHIMFDDGDPERPNCFEHYNPTTGQPCRYRGIDDYQHSWVVDLIVKYLAGIRPGDTSVTIDPFPADVAHLAIDDVPVRGTRLGVTRTEDRFSVRVDGETVDEQPLGSSVPLSL